MEKRRKPRQQRRLSCELRFEGKRHTGILRDVSGVGLYVQTRVKAKPGAEIELVFAADGPRPEVRVFTRVARQERLTAHFASSGAGGLGLEVLESVPGLEILLESAGFASGSPAAVAESDTLRPFRVKLVAIQGGRAQTVSVLAPSKQGARSRALSRAGQGWKVSEVLDGS